MKEVSRSTIVAAKTALWSREARRALFDPNVAMIDFGHPSTGGQVDYDSVAVRIHVREKLAPFQIEAAISNGVTRATLPQTLGGFKTDIQEKKFQLHFWPWIRPRPLVAQRNQRLDPLEGGISISDEFRFIYGTLGGIVVDRSTGDPMVLSNWHVLAPGWSANPRYRILQPGIGDGGTSADAIANFTRHGMFQHVDAAVGTLTPHGRKYLGQQLGLPGAAAGAGAPRFGMKLIKSGRGSDITHGVIDSLASGPIKVPYSGREQIIQPAFIINPAHEGQPASAPGDSGSIWFEEATMRAIGLHFAGSDNPEHAVAIEMPTVLNVLGVDLL